MTSNDLAAAVIAQHELYLLTGDRLAGIFAEHRLTPATAHALWIIDPEQPAPSMKAMTERLYCNASNLTFITNQLIDRGLTERVVDPRDRRSRVLTLTDRGRRVRAEIIRATLDRSPLAALDAAEVAHLRALLEKALGTPGSAGNAPPQD